jgi:hypothetical protein
MLETYKISMFENTREFLELVAKKGGKQSKGGKPDVTGAAKQVIKDWVLGKIKFFTEPPTTTSTSTTNGDWRTKVKMTELQAAEEASIFPLLKSGTQQSFTTYGDAQLFNRKVEVKFLNFLEGREMEEEGNDEEEDGMDEANEEEGSEDGEEEADEDDEEEVSSSKKGKAKQQTTSTKSRKAKEAAKGAMALEGDFDFATDFVATSDVAGGLVGLEDEDDDDDYEGEEDDEEENGEEDDEESD